MRYIYILKTARETERFPKKERGTEERARDTEKRESEIEAVDTQRERRERHCQWRCFIHGKLNTLHHHPLIR